MNYSTHYNLNLAEGTDLVNPLTVDVPNYQTIDNTMYANEQSGIGSATELKTGTIHAITRTAPTRNVFKFTATSIFNLGDTFTVDGNVVTALYPDQSSLKNRCFIVGSEILCLLNGSQLTVLTSFVQNASEVPFDDTGVYITASNVQTAIEEVCDDLDDLAVQSYTSEHNMFTIKKQGKVCYFSLRGSNCTFDADGISLSDTIPSAYRPFASNDLYTKVFNGNNYVDCRFRVNEYGGVQFMNMTGSAISGIQLQFIVNTTATYITA